MLPSIGVAYKFCADAMSICGATDGLFIFAGTATASVGPAEGPDAAV